MSGKEANPASAARLEIFEFEKEIIEYPLFDSRCEALDRAVKKTGQCGKPGIDRNVPFAEYK